MKKITFILTLALGFFAISCESQLDIPQKSVIDTETAYTTAGPVEAKQFLAGIYRDFFSNVNDGCLRLALDVMADDNIAGGGGPQDDANQFQTCQDYRMTPTSWPAVNAYQKFYANISLCNMFIDKVPDTVPGIKRMKDEANFMRAVDMFNLIRWYGNPPLVEHQPNPDVPEEFYPANTDKKTSILWVLDRMKEAADALPAISGKGQQASFPGGGGRVSKHAALAYMGKAALWYGTRYNDSEILAMSVEPLKTVVNSNLYGLVDPSIIGRTSANYCSEYLFEHSVVVGDGFPTNQTRNDHQWRTFRRECIQPPTTVEEGWGFGGPSIAFAEFLMNHEGGIDGPRFKSWIHTYEQVLELPVDPGMTAGINSFLYNTAYFRWRGLLFREDRMPGAPSGDYSSSANIYFLRYAEVLLLYAEAQFLVNGDSDGSGLRALNQVRERAALEPLATLTLQSIKDERRAELWDEGERFFDLQRWGDAPAVLANKGKKVVRFFGYKPGTTEYDIREEAGKGEGWKDKYMLFPYPTAQLSANPNLVQNLGW